MIRFIFSHGSPDRPCDPGAAIGGIAQGVGAVGAATVQANAENNASQLEYQASQNALGFQQNVFNTQQANAAPFIQAGQGAVTNLSQLMGPNGALSQQWNQQFQAPTAVTMQNDPAYQFDLQQGQQALQRSAAAKGVGDSGGAAKALTAYTQGNALNAYQNVFNNALTQYQQSYNQFQQGQSNQFNRLASLAGLGQTSTGQLNSAGTAAANNVSNNLLGTASQIGANTVGAGNALASGLAGVGNAVNSGISNSQGQSILGQLLGGGGQTAQYGVAINPMSAFDQSVAQGGYSDPNTQMGGVNLSSLYIPSIDDETGG